jgi:hypothetical protein
VRAMTTHCHQASKLVARDPETPALAGTPSPHIHCETVRLWTRLVHLARIALGPGITIRETP